MIFHPISQLQGFGFSPVTGFLRDFLNCGRQSLHPLKFGIRRLRRAVEPYGARNAGDCPGLFRVVPPGPAFDFFWDEAGHADRAEIHPEIAV